MNITRAVRVIAQAAHGQPILFGSDDTAQAAKLLADRPNHFYLDQSPGYASAIAVGVALHSMHTTIVVDDARSVLGNVAALVTAGALTDLPLVHIVLDDTPPTSGHGNTSSRTDLCGLAMAVGYPRTYTIDHTDDLADLVRNQVTHCPSPVFVRCPLADSTSSALARIGRHRGNTRPHRTGPPLWFTDAA